jgi:hypothetical protein
MAPRKNKLPAPAPQTDPDFTLLTDATRGLLERVRLYERVAGAARYRFTRGAWVALNDAGLAAVEVEKQLRALGYGPEPLFGDVSCPRVVAPAIDSLRQFLLNVRGGVNGYAERIECRDAAGKPVGSWCFA